MKVFTDNDIEEKQWRAWSYDGFDKSIILVLEPKVLTRCPCIAFHLLLSREHLSWTGSKRTVYEIFFFFIQVNPTYWKANFMNSGEWVKPWLFQTLTHCWLRNHTTLFFLSCCLIVYLSVLVWNWLVIFNLDFLTRLTGFWITKKVFDNIIMVVF
jgi:hypothetical protein